MNSEDAAAPTKTVTDDDGMSWWYRWLCKIAGVLGGICKYCYQSSIVFAGFYSMVLIQYLTLQLLDISIKYTVCFQ